MKIISLNTWCGRAGKENLIDFFSRHKDTDIFCLQEMWEGGHEHAAKWGGDIMTDMVTRIGEILPDHLSYFRPHYMDWYGLTIFAKKSLKINEEGDLFVFKTREDAFDDNSFNHARNLQYITIETERGIRTIFNFHGLWNGLHKNDTDERILQSDNVIEILERTTNPYILCGDFNLSPETRSLKKLEDIGIRNLIKEFDVISTRSSHYKKPVRFADYTLVTKDITVNEFKILPDEVSDHLAMYLDFE